MSIYGPVSESDIECENKLSLVVRKPQEGKTTICITSITRDQTKNIHVVLTMNTLASGMQFFGRMQDIVGSKRIVVFNSKKQTAGECYHAKNVDEVFDKIDSKPIKVIVCCAHEKRIRESIPRLMKRASDSIKFSQTNVKFTIHIDEAHRYIPENVKFIREFNEMGIVNEIIGYSATPDGIWSECSSDPLFHKILIRDVQAELDIIRSPEYFGVNRCKFNIYDDLDHNELVNNYGVESAIPLSCARRSYPAKSDGSLPRYHPVWYEDDYRFALGNERLFLSFINYILPLLTVPTDTFSYHFVPAYTRKPTHYQTMELILKHYPNANVIVMNSNGFEMFRIRESNGKSHRSSTDQSVKSEAERIQNETKRRRVLSALNEPSYMIQQLIKEHPNKPTFVTGFTCVGMSVTLINEALGNLDSVVMAHHHYTRDKLYQLCRFLFKYDSWSPENKARIKDTQFYSLTKHVVDTCLEYETHIEHMCTEFAGRACSLREIQGLEPEEPTKLEMKNLAIANVKLVNPAGKTWKKFKVYDGNDEEQWRKVAEFYQEITGNSLDGKSKPERDGRGFYQSSDSKDCGVKTTTDFLRLDSEKWSNRFLLQKGRLNYARVFVGYDNTEQNDEYTIFVKFAQLEDSPESRAFLEEYGK